MIYYVLRLLQIVLFLYVIPSFIQTLTSQCTRRKQQVESRDFNDVKLSCKTRKRRKTKSLSKDERLLQEKRKTTEERWILKQEKVANEEKIKQEKIKEIKNLIDTELYKKEMKSRKIQEKLEFEEQQRLAEEEVAEKRMILKERLKNERIKQLEEIKAEEKRLLPEMERKQKEWKEYEERTVEIVKKEIQAKENVCTKKQAKNRLRKNKNKNLKEIIAEETERKQIELKEYEEITLDTDETEQEEDFYFEYIFDDSKSRTIWFLNKHTQERIQTELFGLPCPPWPGVTSGWDQTLVDEGLSALEHFFISEEVNGNCILPSYVEVNIWVLHCIMVLEKRLHFINQTRWNYHRTELLVKWFMNLNQDLLSLITDDMDKYGVFNSRESAFYNWIKTCTIPGGIYLFYVITEFQSGQNKGLEAWENQPISNTYHLKYKAHRRSKYISNTRLSI